MSAEEPTLARGLLDTSVFIANETGRSVLEAALPLEAAVSVVTIAELKAGVLVADDATTRAVRMATIEAIAEAGIDIIPIDVQAAEWWALARVRLFQAGRRANVNDLWIAATAAARQVPVITQDADFDPIEAVTGLKVVRV